MLYFFLLFMATASVAQTGEIRGTVVDAATKTPLPGVNVTVVGTTIGAATDAEGAYRITGVPVGVVALEARFIGFLPQQRTDIVVQANRPTQVFFELREQPVELEGVAVQANAFLPPADAPTSVRVLGAEEIRRAPGGQNDVSRTLLSLPGVTGGVDNRNDLVVRGGGPSENAYYMDGIRIPQINHFATQGATGGAVGLLNVSFIQEVEFLTGGFPVRYGDALSSVLLIQNRPGNPERIVGEFTLGAAEAGLTLDGPLGNRSSWLLSARRSYLQFLFEALGLPIRPSYWDGQFRLQTEITPKDRLVITAIGALDRFGVVEVEADDTFENQEIADRVLTNDQDAYTVGVSWRRLVNEGFLTSTLSYSSSRFAFGGEGRDGAPVIRSSSLETDLRASTDLERRVGRRATLGLGGDVVVSGLRTDFFERSRPGTPFGQNLQFGDDLTFARAGLYAQWIQRSGRLTTTVGLRADQNTLLDNGFSVSPRAAATLEVNSRWSLNLAGGLFTQSPARLSLAVQDAQGNSVNTGLRPVQTAQIVGGIAFQPRADLRMSVEGYYKAYSRYPVSAEDPRISLANLGDDFGFVGAFPLDGSGKGRAYGLEAFAQRKLTDRLYGIAAYTLGWSEFAAKDGVYRPASWDVRHSLSLTGGYRIGNKWEFSSKWRVLSGRPWTPFDFAASEASYAVNRNGVPDLDQLNTLRTPTYSRMDVRIDRRFFFQRWNAVVYLDVQNVFNQTNLFGYRYTEDPEVPSRLRPVDNVGLLPIFGFTVEW